ncbi:MAG: general stress protein, partial [Bacillota bacterium]
MANVIGIFDDREHAENAVNEIREAGITDDKISIVAKEDTIQSEGEGEGEGEDLTTGAPTGGALGGIAGLMAGAGALTIPGVGPILAAGPLAAGLSGVAAGGLAGSLVDLGIDRERGQYYEDEVKRGGILAT